jgi:import receptor subunit TOM70
MSNPLPSMPPGRPAAVAVDANSSSTWDRISSWVSENKAVVYTIAGVAVVVTGAGVVYYLNSDSVRLWMLLWSMEGLNDCMTA